MEEKKKAVKDFEDEDVEKSDRVMRKGYWDSRCVKREQVFQR